ncbi:hypothetical protein OC834_001361 [Tilletia horrida]|nr:hypothetical protein OC834_001361 [Tilletia horrida]
MAAVGSQSSSASGALATVRPYQVLAVSGLATIVLLGSTYAALGGTSSYNLFFSDPLRFPSSAGASQPSTLFADRRNLLNAVFVKKIWAWTTAAFVAQAVVLRRPWSRLLQRASGTDQPGPNDPLVRSILRFIIATVAWVFFTSWFLGPSLADRTFLLTGGECRLEVGSSSIRVPSEICRARTKVSFDSHPQLFQVEGFSLGEHDVSTLKNLSPRFRGGIDMSGHTFLLTLAFMLLLEEIVPFVPYLFLRLPATVRPSKAQIEWLIPRAQWASFDPFNAPSSSRTAPDSSSSTISSTNSTANGNGGGAAAAAGAGQAGTTFLDWLSRPHVQAQLTAGAVLMHMALSVWMLIMTQLFFHTWTEKLAGLVIGVVSWVALPKDLAPLRSQTAAAAAAAKVR